MNNHQIDLKSFYCDNFIKTRELNNYIYHVLVFYFDKLSGIDLTFNLNFILKQLQADGFDPKYSLLREISFHTKIPFYKFFVPPFGEFHLNRHHPNKGYLDTDYGVTHYMDKYINYYAGFLTKESTSDLAELNERPVYPNSKKYLFDESVGSIRHELYEFINNEEEMDYFNISKSEVDIIHGYLNESYEPTYSFLKKISFYFSGGISIGLFLNKTEFNYIVYLQKNYIDALYKVILSKKEDSFINEYDDFAFNVMGNIGMRKCDCNI